MSSKQIYSATYSNIPVFEFVTEEGPIMRRKLDSWINATHILKIAKFPKAKRTRILEKDVQTGVHEKVQGGYGKYQGTYVPLNSGIQLAKNFGVYEILQPIFEFQYIEGKSATPPPAPKHNHASASNVAQRMNSSNGSREDLVLARKSKSTNSINEPPRKRGRPKRVPLGNNQQTPNLKYSDTTQINPVTRQNTEQDALNIMANMTSVKNEDLEMVGSSENEDINNEEVDFISGKELFGTPRNSFDRMVYNRMTPHQTPYQFNNQHGPPSGNHLLPYNNGINYSQVSHSRTHSQNDPYSLQQYHHPNQNNNLLSFKDEGKYSEYFHNLLNFFLEDTNQASSKNDQKRKDNPIPENLLHPPEPILKININQPIDNEGNSIFHWACSMGNSTNIEFLINNFPNIINSNLKNNNGETPLMFLIKFNNSYQLKNFPNLLELLFDSILTVDNFNKTVLHHLALTVQPPPTNVVSQGESFNGFSNDENQINNYLKNKERIARYYIESLFIKIIEYQTINNIEHDELIKKFINHQDSDGNTAFHLVSYNLNKKLIKIFIDYHKFINFNIKNLVNYTAEQYLASHNYILKLENDENNDQDSRLDISSMTGSGPISQEKSLNNNSSSSSINEKDKPIALNELTKSFTLQSFESQLYYSKMTVNLTNSKNNIITEKLNELQYLIDKELNKKDEKLLKLIKVNSKFNNLKVTEQKVILKMFKLDNLIQDNNEEIDSQIDLKRDKIIQDEINRFLNDLTFQVLQKDEKLNIKLKEFKMNYLKNFKQKLVKVANEIQESSKSDSSNDDEKFKLSIDLQNEIIKSNNLLSKLFKLSSKVPNLNKDDFKENKSSSIISNYPSDDKLNKYCKLISLCCDMNINDVEHSINSIEQSLMSSIIQKDKTT